MKKTLNVLIVLFIAVTIFTVNTKEIEAKSNGYYDFYCPVGQFELSYITDDGRFEKDSCYNSFSEARTAMEKKGSDYVVRNYNSQSPSMIVAMLSGKAYTYPARSGSATMNIYQDVEERYYNKKTYVANHYELDYEYTERAFSSGVGMIKVSLIGFDGYTDLEYTDLVPDKFIDNGLAIYLGGNDKTGADEQPFRVIVRRNYYTVNSEQELVYVYHRSYSNKSNSLDEEHKIVLGPAPSQFKSGKVYYSANGYDFYTDPQYEDYYTTYYPYYQYLPLRSKSNLSGDDLDSAFEELATSGESAMEGNGDLFVAAQEEYGINALLLYAMAAHESAWGTSYYALNRNNLFGWNAIDSDPNQASSFASLSQAIDEHAGYNLRKYTDIYNPLFFGTHLGNKGSGLNVKYASDPYWGMKIAAIAYSIDKENGTVDYGEYEFATVSEFDAEFRSTSGKRLFTAQYGPYYQEAFTVIVLAEEGDETLVQSPNPLSGSTVYTTYEGSGPIEEVYDVVTYDFDESQCYIDSDSLSYSGDATVVPPTSSTIEVSFDEFFWSDSIQERIDISGEIYCEDHESKGADVTMYAIGEHNYRYGMDIRGSGDTLQFSGYLDVTTLTKGDFDLYLEVDYVDGYKERVRVKVSAPQSKNVQGRYYGFNSSNGYLSISVKNAQTITEKNVSIINEIDIGDDTLYIDGLAFISGTSYDSISTHDIIIYDLSSKDEVLRQRADTYKNTINLNDGYRYDYIGYEATIDLSSLRADRSYVITISVDERDPFDITDSKFITESGTSFDRSYILRANPSYYSRLELTVLPNIEKFDVADIEKPSQRESFTSNELWFEDGQIRVKGYGWIFYSDFGSDDSKNYDIFLVSEDNSYKLETALVEPFASVGDMFKSNDYSDVYYDAWLDLDKIEPGNYTVYLLIEQYDDGYYDFIPLTDQQMLTNDSTSYGDSDYYLHAIESTKRIELSVE